MKTLSRVLLRIFTAYFEIYREAYYAYHEAKENVLGIDWGDDG